MKKISVETLRTKMSSEKKVNVIDVREQDEYNAMNNGGLLLPLDDIMAKQISPIEGMKDEDIYLICRSGKRSAKAGLYLEAMGFTKVNNVEGGMLAWENLHK